ncbi:MAG: threonine synthase [Proteobacteria bacterium]|nr:threonine synthase [Pseudomonadota bacterium]
MLYRSTRGAAPVTLDEALVLGIASDGGLFVPESLPDLGPQDFRSTDDIRLTARTLLTPFFRGSELEKDLDEIIAETFNFPIPVTPLPVSVGRCGLLELYHGPTAAFKDIGAQFLAACLTRLDGDRKKPLTILVATSGDTGGAVAAAFDERPGMRVVVLFPNGRVSDRQAHQLTCWSDNVLSLAVNGSFDDCQMMVKGAMADEALSAKYRFSSANSINVGRLLPQAIYYAHASLQHFRKYDRRSSFVIPTGNLGNAFACFLARAVGLPIGDIVLATNANRIINDFLDDGTWEPRASIETLASAMDVGNPSNMERLRKLGGEARELAGKVRAVSVNDSQITQQIKQNFDEFGFAICPHTATATYAWRNLDPAERMEKDWILVATAHPAKFESIVEPVIGTTVPLPAELAGILARPRRFDVIEPTALALESVLSRRFGS